MGCTPTSATMSNPPLDNLKKGLSTLKKHVKACKDDLVSCLQRKEKISDDDEHWLDNEANQVEEEAIIMTLENASDYEHGLEQLNSQQKTMVGKLRELGSGINQVVGKKRKSVFLCSVEWID